MVAFFDPRSVTGRNLNDDQILQILGDINLSEIEDFDEDDDDFAPNFMGDLNDLYNQHMGGVDVPDQQMEYYRTFIKTKKWTLKVLIHFLNLAIVNSWRLYRDDCQANNLTRKDILPLLDFRLNIAIEDYRVPHPENAECQVILNIIHQWKMSILLEDTTNQTRPANKPSDAKRYDEYDHFPVFDEIKAPRMCRHESCGSRTKIRCKKCDTMYCTWKKIILMVVNKVQTS